MTDRFLPLDERLATWTPPRLGDVISPFAARELAVITAYRGVGHVAPNPLVGAVVVSRDGRFLGYGAHLRLGESHAEVNALKGLTSEALRGGTIYVTLEPCAHEGRTPACAPFVAKSGLARVVYGVVDPNPKVNGLGDKILRDAGVASEHDKSWQSACEEVGEIFLHNQTKRRPYVAMKAAVSSNGMIGRKGDERVWITGERARQYGRFLRGYYDAIMIGANTLERDDPLLDTRDTLVPCRPPLRFVLDPTARLANRGWKLLKSGPERTVWIVSDSVKEEVVKPLIEMGATVKKVPAPRGRFAAASLVSLLKEAEITSLLLEGGSHLYGTFLKEGLIDRVHLFKAPTAIDGDDALPLIPREFGLTLPALKKVRVGKIGPDTLTEGLI